MIIEFKEDRVTEIAEAQVGAWQKAFKGILSDELLSGLAVAKFAENWTSILAQKERKNYIYVNEQNKGVGFISYGQPKDQEEAAHFEIYGIYVHPAYWGQGIGYQLMQFAIDAIVAFNPSVKIILWTMHENNLSKKFYKGFGFTETRKRRVSQRNEENFEEIQFEIQIEKAT